MTTKTNETNETTTAAARYVVACKMTGRVRKFHVIDTTTDATVRAYVLKRSAIALASRKNALATYRANAAARAVVANRTDAAPAADVYVVAGGPSVLGATPYRVEHAATGATVDSFRSRRQATRDAAARNARHAATAVDAANDAADVAAADFESLVEAADATAVELRKAAAWMRIDLARIATADPRFIVSGRGRAHVGLSDPSHVIDTTTGAIVASFFWQADAQLDAIARNARFVLTGAV